MAAGVQELVVSRWSEHSMLFCTVLDEVHGTAINALLLSLALLAMLAKTCEYLLWLKTGATGSVPSTQQDSLWVLSSPLPLVAL
jgi:hypothetical protein